MSRLRAKITSNRRESEKLKNMTTASGRFKIRLTQSGNNCVQYYIENWWLSSVVYGLEIENTTFDRELVDFQHDYVGVKAKEKKASDAMK